jgi:hypothetical protein
MFGGSAVACHFVSTRSGLVRTAVLVALAAPAATALAPSVALAQNAREGVRLDTLQPATPSSPFFRAEGPQSPDVDGVDFAIGATMDFATGSLRATGVDRSNQATTLPAPVDTLLIAHLGASLTPLHWLTLELAMPFALVEKGDLASGAAVSYAGDTAANPSAPGVGDLRVGAQVRPINKRAFSVLAGARFWAPIGSEAAYMSDARPRFEVNLGVAGEATRALYGCTVGLSPMFFGQRVGDRVSAACALHARITGSFSLGVEPTFNLQWVGTKLGDDRLGVLFEPLGAARLRLGGFSVGIGAGPGLGHAPGTAAFRGVLALAYTGQGRPEKLGPSEALDSDFDGIPDADDACPRAAGPSERKGCPLLDADGDGVTDAEDACPSEAGVKHGDPRAHGCPDADNDKLPDPIDACPIEPGPGPTGCPRFARLSEDGFRLSLALDFKGGSPKLTPDQTLALQEVAAIMRANPKLEQVSLSLGTRGTSAALSDQRAQTLLVVLGAASLDSNRYEVVLSDDQAGVVKLRLIR